MLCRKSALCGWIWTDCSSTKLLVPKTKILPGFDDCLRYSKSFFGSAGLAGSAGFASLPAGLVSPVA